MSIETYRGLSTIDYCAIHPVEPGHRLALVISLAGRGFGAVQHGVGRGGCHHHHFVRRHYVFICAQWVMAFGGGFIWPVLGTARATFFPHHVSNVGTFIDFINVCNVYSS